MLPESTGTKLTYVLNRSSLHSSVVQHACPRQCVGAGVNSELSSRFTAHLLLTGFFDVVDE